MKDQERTPLRTILINFLNHIEHLESEKFPEKTYESEFQDLKLFSESLKGLHDYSCSEGEKEVNKRKNRYKDILPFDSSRVVLNEYTGIPGSDYINANYIKGASGSVAYIASQGPLFNTVNDFWRMVVQCEVQVIVMACNEDEAGKTKCEKYWVEDKEEKNFGMVSVRLLKASIVCPDFSVRTMRLKYTNNQSILEERTICQLHYLAWPDHGVPSVVQPLLDMVKLVRDTQASETLPVLVHCSAGCGRTGTICAIDYVWGLLRTGKLTKEFTLSGLVREMRKQRIAMVQTKEQYVLVHQAVRELFKEQLTVIDSHPYENIDTNGMIRLKEEPLYDSASVPIVHYGCKEKVDENEKEVTASHMLRHQGFVLTSKQEKEVENRTARQKLLGLIESKCDTTNSSVISSRFVSTNEKNNSSDINNSKEILKSQSSHTLKKQVDSPLGCTWTDLKSCYCHESCFKRSMSLKVNRNQEVNNMLSLEVAQGECSSNSSLSLKSLIKTDSEDHMNSIYSRTHKNVHQLVKDYEALSIINRRPLGRSYTTLDMSSKPILRLNNAEDSKYFNKPHSVIISEKRKKKLYRSNTEIELRKSKKWGETLKNSSPTHKKEILNNPKEVDCGKNTSHQDLKKLSNFKTGSNYVAHYKNIGDSNFYEMNNFLTLGQPSASSSSHESDVKKSERSLKPRCSLKTENKLLIYSPKIVTKLRNSKITNSQNHTGVYEGQFFNLNEEYENGSYHQRNKIYSSTPYKSTRGIVLPCRSFLQERIIEKSPLHKKLSVFNKSYYNNTSKNSEEPIYSNLSFNRNIKSNVKNNISSQNLKKLCAGKPYLNQAPNISPVTSQRSYKKKAHFSIPPKGPNSFSYTDSTSVELDKHIVSKYKKDSESVSFRKSVFQKPDSFVADDSSCNKDVQNKPFENKFKISIVDKIFMEEHSNNQVGDRICPDEMVLSEKGFIIGTEGAQDSSKGSSKSKVYGERCDLPAATYSCLRYNQNWQSAPGVDIDQVAASISQKDVHQHRLIKSALKSLHIRKGKQNAEVPSGAPHSGSGGASEKSKKQEYL